MVRNVDSMQDLRGTTAVLNISPAAADSAQQPPPSLRLDRTGPPVAQATAEREEKTGAGRRYISPGERQDETTGERVIAEEWSREGQLKRPTSGNGPLVHDRRRELLAEKEREDLRYGSPSSIWEQYHDPLLHKPPSDLTADDNARLETKWKSYLSHQRSKRTKARDNSTGQEKAGQDGQPYLPRSSRAAAAQYTKPFCDFLTENPTVFHAIGSFKSEMKSAGWTELNEREAWEIEPSGKYFVDRNGSSLISFVVGANYKPGNGAAILAGHVDALTAKLKPVSDVPGKAGYSQLGVAPYGGAMNSTWWDRDLGIAGRVLVKEGDKVVTKLVKLDWPIARIPTLAPHFGAAAAGPFNKETEMVPIIGLEDTDGAQTLEYETLDPFSQPSLVGGKHGGLDVFVNTQPRALVEAVSKALGLSQREAWNIVNWELELYDCQPATVGGINKDFIFAGRIDDKLCSWAAMRALLDGGLFDTNSSSVIKMVGLFDDEEIGSLARQGARGNFLPSTLERVVGSLGSQKRSADVMGRTYANSFLVSSDVTHAVNPNFVSAYLARHAPHLNVGLAVAADSNGHMTTDSVSTAMLGRCVERVSAQLQLFQIRNDGRSGGTVGPMLSAMTGIRAIDAGMPQLSMHSIRAATGCLDPGLGVIAFMGVLNGFESVDKEFGR